MVLVGAIMVAVVTVIVSVVVIPATVVVPVIIAVSVMGVVAVDFVPAAMEAVVVTGFFSLMFPPAVFPFAMLLTGAVAIPVVVSIPAVISVPVAVVIAIAVSLPVRPRGTGWLRRVAVPTSVGPASAVRRHAAIGCVRRNAVVLIEVLYAAFHAADFAVVVRGLVALPAGVVAVKPFLIADREPNLRMSEMGQGERHE